MSDEFRAQLTAISDQVRAGLAERLRDDPVEAFAIFFGEMGKQIAWYMEQADPEKVTPTCYTAVIQAQAGVEMAYFMLRCITVS